MTTQDRKLRNHILGGGWVYFICATKSGAIKVGHAKNVQRRLKALRTASPEPLELIAYAPGDTWVEARLHKAFAAGRLHGEWFSPDAPKLREMVAGARACAPDPPVLSARVEQLMWGTS